MVMRPLAHASSALQQPLDGIFGTPAAVRILRIMVRHGGALSPPNIAMRAEMTRSGTNKTLRHLATLRIIDIVGQGRYVSYQFNAKHPLAPAITALFDAERQRVDAVFEHIRKTAESLNPAPIAVWLYGSAARGDDTMQSDMDLAVVGRESDVCLQTEVIRDALLDKADCWMVQPSVIRLSTDAIAEMDRDGAALWQNLKREAVPIFGIAPGQVRYG
jgi:predicted nucleotidyltransferase